MGVNVNRVPTQISSIWESVITNATSDRNNVEVLSKKHSILVKEGVVAIVKFDT